MKSPIFLLSLPRSGSTLLQRILMGHKKIFSVAEPWVLLPFFYANKQQGIVTEYSHETSSVAINEFIETLPAQDDDYYNALRVFIETLYKKQLSDGERYFLDKTPRYYLCIPELARTFPDAKFIFLFRNPVHIMSSVIQTWGDGKLRKLYGFDTDLKRGPQLLTDGYELLKDKSYALRYEDFLRNPAQYVTEICEYLGIDFDPHMLDAFSSQTLEGQMKDPTGIDAYQSIDLGPLVKWKKTFNTHFRKKMLTDYVKSLDDSFFKGQGYDRDEILKEISAIDAKFGNVLTDRIDIFLSHLVTKLKLNIWIDPKTNGVTANAGRFLN